MTTNDSIAPLDRARLAEKVAWEGGTFEALRYGIRADDIGDPELAALWRDMEELYERMSPLTWKIDALLAEAA